MNEINNIFDGLKAFPQTDAIALGGSRSTGLNDGSSDYDVYVYISSEIPEAERRDLLSRYCRVTEIGKAVLRGDSNAVTHRTAEFLASYYDVIFALNRLTHPGEKRLAEICAKRCAVLPDNFKTNLDRLFAELYTDKTPENISRIVNELDAVLTKEKGGSEP